MATKQEIENARNLKDLDVKEFSIVDRPANLREFLVVKRNANGDSDAVESQQFETVSKAQDALDWFVNAAGDLDDNGHVEIVKSILGDFITKEAEGRKDQEMADVTKEAGQAEAEVKTEQVETEKKEATKESAFPPGFVPGKPGKPGKPGAKDEDEDEDKEKTKCATTKSVDVPANAQFAVLEDGTIIAKGVEVAKAKGFTAGRTEALKSAALGMLQVLADVGEIDTEALKALTGDPTGKELPKDPKVQTALAKSAAPSCEDLGTIIAKAVGAAIQPVIDRVETIEKSRQPSKSVEGDGDTQTVKTEKSFWGNVIR